MAEFTILANTAGVRPAIRACPALLAIAVAWAPLSLGDEPTNGQPTEEDASQSAEVPAAVVLGPEAIEQAHALMDAGDAEGAIALLRDYAPQSAFMQTYKRMTLAAAHFELKDWESVLAQYVGVIEAPGGPPVGMAAQVRLGAGHACMMLERYEDAVTHWEAWKGVVVEPQAGVYAQISRAHKELGQYALAIENMEAGLRIAEEEVRTADGDARVVMHFRNQLAELRRQAAEQ